MQPSLGLPPLELCFGTSPIQAEKSRPDRNVLGSANAGDKRGGESRADTGNLIKSSACLAGPMPSPDHAVERQNLRFNPMELIAKRRQTGTGNLWNLLVLRSGDDIKQLLNTLTADRRNDAKLSAMSPDCIDHVCCRINKCRVRWSTRPLCCSGVLIGTNRMLALLTASHIASASVASFFWRLT